MASTTKSGGADFHGGQEGRWEEEGDVESSQRGGARRMREGREERMQSRDCGWWLSVFPPR